MTRPIVLKVSGHQIDEPAFLAELADVVAKISQPVIVVHGGGKEISSLQERLGIKPQYVDGVRVTDEATLSIVTMVLAGLVNKRIVHTLLEAGVDALGMSGIDRGIVRARQMLHAQIDMGYTGEVVNVYPEPLLQLLKDDITPVIAPLCSGSDTHYNVNGDHVAGAIAAAVNAQRIVFLSNVEGVLVDGAIRSTLTAVQSTALIDDGLIYGGMIPKVRTALEALQAGVSSAVITNLDGLRNNGGTMFVQTSENGVTGYAS